MTADKGTTDLRAALERLLTTAFVEDDFRTQNGIRMAAPSGVRRAIKAARAALASTESERPALDVEALAECELAGVLSCSPSHVHRSDVRAAILAAKKDGGS